MDGKLPNCGQPRASRGGEARALASLRTLFSITPRSPHAITVSNAASLRLSRHHDGARRQSSSTSHIQHKVCPSSNSSRPTKSARSTHDHPTELAINPLVDALALRLRAALASLARPASHWSHRIDRAGRPLRGLRLAGPLAAYRVGAGPASGPTDQDHTLRCRLCGDAALGRRAAGAPRPVPAPRGRVERGPRN
jgi:hypothetical protein